MIKMKGNAHGAHGVNKVLSAFCTEDPHAARWICGTHSGVPFDLERLWC